MPTLALLGYHLHPPWNVSPVRQSFNALRMSPHAYSRCLVRLYTTHIPTAPPSFLCALTNTSNCQPLQFSSGAFPAICTCPVHTVVRPESRGGGVPQEHPLGRHGWKLVTNTPAPSPQRGTLRLAVHCFPVPHGPRGEHMAASPSGNLLNSHTASLSTAPPPLPRAVPAS